MSIDISSGTPKNEFIYTLADVKNELKIRRNEGLKRGAWVGFDEFSSFYSAKKGSTTYIISPAAVGKTSIVYEILLNLSEFEGWKLAIFSPEGGSPADLYAEMLWALLRKPFMKHNVPNMPLASDKEVEAAMKFMDEHFYIIDAGIKDLNADMYFKTLLDLEKEKGVKIDGFVIDPVVEINYNPLNEREDVALGKFLTRVRKHASQYNMHAFISVHTKNQQPITAEINGERVQYLPPPRYDDTQGGMMWSRKGFMIMSLWRPPAGMINPKTEQPYAPNETVVEILKRKPKIMGQIGKFSLFYDYWSSRFKDSNGDFSYPKEKSNLLEYRKKKKEVKQEKIGF